MQDKEIGPCSAEFGLSNASQFDWMGMSVRTSTHRYVEWREWDGATLAPKWEGLAAAVELYTHAPDDGDFASYVNSEDINLAGVAGHEAMVKKLAAQIKTVFHLKSDDTAVLPPQLDF